MVEIKTMMIDILIISKSHDNSYLFPLKDKPPVSYDTMVLINKSFYFG